MRIQRKGLAALNSALKLCDVEWEQFHERLASTVQSRGKLKLRIPGGHADATRNVAHWRATVPYVTAREISRFDSLVNVRRHSSV